VFFVDNFLTFQQKTLDNDLGSGYPLFLLVHNYAIYQQTICSCNLVILFPYNCLNLKLQTNENLQSKL